MARTKPATQSAELKEAAFAAANAAEDKKAKGTTVLDVGQVTHLADYFVITGGDSTAQVKAIVEAVEEALTKRGLRARIEGKREGRWVLLDYGDIIVHVLHEKERNFYKMEQFWNHALIVDRADWVRE